MIAAARLGGWPLTEQERADLLIGVKVAFSDTTGALHPGLPITVRFEDIAP